MAAAIVTGDGSGSAGRDCDTQIHRTGHQALQTRDHHRVVRRDFTREVVVDSPAHTGADDQQCTDRHAPCPGCHDRITPPATIAAMPRKTCTSTFSRKTIHAITAVRTPSRFNSSELVAAGVLARPSISNAGPATPPVAMAPISHGNSLLLIRWTVPECSPRDLNARHAMPMPSPRPLPRDRTIQRA